MRETTHVVTPSVTKNIYYSPEVAGNGNIRCNLALVSDAISTAHDIVTRLEQATVRETFFMKLMSSTDL